MKFEIGDKVKYIGRCSTFVTYNSTGVISWIRSDGYDVLFSNGITWFCVEGNLIKFPPESGQLTFNFYVVGQK